MKHEIQMFVKDFFYRHGQILECKIFNKIIKEAKEFLSLNYNEIYFIQVLSKMIESIRVSGIYHTKLKTMMDKINN